ncbi:MAG: GTP 3',8-cyclase MoaA [Dehalococcoidales bacterium]|nr:GTP 3',8-cyclase MoaA [Dehalococcoidales bacterium]
MTCLSDSFQRPINYLRISVTDRCNLRCVYCMPEEGIPFLNHAEILTFEEINRIIEVAAELGITKVRITGGEPLVRLGLTSLIRMITRIKTIEDIALTTNGILLAEKAAELKAAGLKRVNISIDTLRPERFQPITRCQYELGDVMAGIKAAEAAGLHPVKLNMVAMAGINDDEIIDFGRKTITDGWNVRFIELMPFTSDGQADARFLPVTEIKKRLDPLGKMEPYKHTVGVGPAKYFRFAGANGTVGFITPVTEHFCFNCNRMRLTSDGKLRPCLLSDKEIDLKQPLRHNISQEELKKLYMEAVKMKPRQHNMNEQTQVKRPMRQVGG